MEPEDFFSIAEIEHSSGISRETIRRKIASGQIKAHRIGKVWRVPFSEIKKLLSGALGPVPRVFRRPINSPHLIETAMLNRSHSL